VRLSRRLLFWALFASLLLARFGQAISLGQATTNNAPSTVAIVQSDVLVADHGEIESMVRQALQLAPGLEELIEPGDVVVIKPNLVMDVSPETGMITDTRVVRALVRIAQELHAGQVYIAEGSARYSSGDANRDRYVTRHAFQVAGYDLDGDMVDDATGIPLVDLNISGEALDARDPNYVTLVNVAMGLIRKEYWLPNLVLEADVVISVPTLKNHYLAGTTLGMKNMVGVAPNDIYHAPGEVCEKKELSHADVELQQHIVDLNLARKPDYVVVDGLRGMIDGPIGSQTTDPPMGLIIAGRDVVAVDTVGTLIMGYDPKSVPYLRMAEEVNLGTTETAWIQVVGKSVARVRRDFPAPYGELPVTRAESQPPLVDITFPHDGTSLAESTQVLVEVMDDVGVARVELYVDDSLVGTDRESPYEFPLNPDSYGLGPHSLRAVAHDKVLNEARDQITISFLSSEPTSTATSISVAQITATPSPTAHPTEPRITPSSLPTLEPSPTVTVTKEPMSREAGTPVPEPPSMTPDNGAPFCGLPLATIALAVGITVGPILLARRRSP
jgi:uncharacterized protein (DUF362 family)